MATLSKLSHRTGRAMILSWEVMATSRGQRCTTPLLTRDSS